MCSETAPADDSYDLVEMAWVILANVSEGNWEKQTDEWQEAVVKWRNHYHAHLDRSAALAATTPAEEKK